MEPSEGCQWLNCSKLLRLFLASGLIVMTGPFLNGPKNVAGLFLSENNGDAAQLTNAGLVWRISLRIAFCAIFSAPGAASVHSSHIRSSMNFFIFFTRKIIPKDPGSMMAPYVATGQVAYLHDK